MNYTHVLAIISFLMTICGTSIYIRDTIKGKTKPNRVSWSMWALAPLIATGAAISASADPWTTFRTFLAGFLPLVVFLVSFVNKKSYWKLTFFDFACGVTSFVALAVWLMFDSPIEALILTIVADAFATLPTMKKAWLFPETETGSTYIAFLFSLLLIVPLMIDVWSIENYVFIIYLIIQNIILIFEIYRKRIFALSKWL